jgi:hypothetical protein
MRATALLTGFILAVGALTMTTGAQAPADNTLTAAEQKAGWKLLFDGKTIDQWRNYKGTEVGTNWTIVDGAITLTTPRRAVDIISKDEFTDFDFTFDWQLAAAPPAGNSGVMFYVIEQGDATYYSGPEYQVLDNATHPDGKNPLTSAGSCYALYAPTRDASRPIGEWNTSRILINKGKAEHWLNGEKIVQYDMNSEEWKAKVAGSKFKEWPEFGLARKGHLAIQQHGAKVAYKNLKVREIK